MGKNLISAGILGVAAYIPEHIRTNDFWDLSKFYNLREGKDPFKGIKERRVFTQSSLPTDIEAEVGRRALEVSGVKGDEIDLVLVQSMVQEEIVPGDACMVQHKLGLKNAGAWTIDTCCSSFVTMVVTASNLIATGEFKKVLIITTSFTSLLADYGDYLSPNIGDAAGAVVMGEVSEGKGYMGSFCNSHGEYHKGFTVKIRQPHNFIRSHFAPSQEKAYLTTEYDLIQDMGRKSVEHMKYVLDRVLEKTNLAGKDIDLFLSHQPAPWVHAAWRDSIGVDSQKSYQSFEKYGNIASATIPTNLFEAINNGMLKDGDNLLIASSGAGENHIAAILRWGK